MPAGMAYHPAILLRAALARIYERPTPTLHYDGIQRTEDVQHRRPNRRMFVKGTITGRCAEPAVADGELQRRMG